MADKNKFEQMLEKLIAEDRAGAEELFHEIVVDKSRTIYEKLLDDDMPEVEVKAKESKDEKADEDEKVDEKSDEKADEDEKVVDEKAKEKADEGDEEVKEELVDITPVEDVPQEADDEIGGDPADAMIGDIEGGDEVDGDGGDDGGEDHEDLEDRVVDLEDALDDLKAEFDAMMGDDDGGDDNGDDDADADADADDDNGDDEGGDDAEGGFPSDLEAEEKPAFEGKEAEAKAEAKGPVSNTELMREYVTKVSSGHGAETKGGGEDGGTNTKSTVASKNDMGGTAGNIAKGGEGGGSNTGLTGNDTKEDSAGNVNVPGGKASKSLKSDSKGHGTEKKGHGEEGGTNTDSVIGS